MNRVQFDPDDSILALRRFHAPGARWDSARKCWWMDDADVGTFLHALDEESICRRTVYVDGQPKMVGVNWQANYARFQASRPVREDPVARSQRVRAQIRAEALRAAA